MKKIIRTLILLLFLCTAFNCLPASSQAATRINMATYFGHEHPVMTKVLVPWSQEIRRNSNGQVDIRFINPGVLLPSREHFNALNSGSLDAAHAPIRNNPGRLPVTGLMNLPTGLRSCVSASEAFWQLYTQCPEMQAEFKNIKVLTMHATAPYQVGVITGQADSLTDLKGRKLLTAQGGESSRLLRTLGANPLMTPTQDFYFSLSRNMAEGCFIPLPDLYAANLQDNLTAISLCDLKMDCYWLGINLDLYNSLPQAAQKAITDASGLKLALAIANVINEMNDTAKAELIKAKKSLGEPQSAERALWLEKSMPILRENWLKQLKRRNIDNGDAIWAKAQNIFTPLQARHATHAPLQRAENVQSKPAL